MTSQVYKIRSEKIIKQRYLKKEELEQLERIKKYQREKKMNQGTENKFSLPKSMKKKSSVKQLSPPNEFKLPGKLMYGSKKGSSKVQYDALGGKFKSQNFVTLSPSKTPKLNLGTPGMSSGSHTPSKAQTQTINNMQSNILDHLNPSANVPRKLELQNAVFHMNDMLQK